MPIQMTYRCNCGYATPILDNAIKHSNTTRHTVMITGGITPSEESRVWKYDADASAMQRAREAAILRTAKERGLI